MSFVVAVDGPAGAGKSTTARGVAERLGFLYLDTGALYRALALKVLEEGVNADDPDAVAACARAARLDLAGAPDETHVWLDGADVSDQIRTPEVSEMSSRLAAQPAVRRRLVEIQRQVGGRGPVVAEGRDIGTVVFPAAQIKVYLDADLETRARRRTLEMQRRGIAASVDQVREDLERRDARDSMRPDSPLRRADDARVVDTTGMTEVDQIEAVVRIARAHPECPGTGSRR